MAPAHYDATIRHWHFLFSSPCEPRGPSRVTRIRFSPTMAAALINTIMDQGIHIPNEFKVTERSIDTEQVLEDADQALCDFKRLIEHEYNHASSLYEGAKNLYEQLHGDLMGDKQRVLRGEWTVDDMDEAIHKLLSKQGTVWDKLKLAGEEIRAKLDAAYSKVKAAEEAVKCARGEGCHVAWLNMPTTVQAKVRRVYARKLKQNFADAKSEYASMCAFPDGMLTQIELLRQRALSDATDMMEKLHKRNPGHDRKILGLKVPVIF